MSWRQDVHRGLFIGRSKLVKLLGLKSGEWQTLVAAAILLPVIGAALRLWGYRRTHAWMVRLANRRNPPIDATREMAQVSRMVAVAASHGLYRANCLRQALAVWWLLERRGIVTTLMMGVRKDEQGFAAHAWVECCGQVLIGGSDARQHYHVMGRPVEGIPNKSSAAKPMRHKQP